VERAGKRGDEGPIAHDRLQGRSLGQGAVSARVFSAIRATVAVARLDSLSLTHVAVRWFALRPPLLIHARSFICAVRTETLGYTYIHITFS
jgi:hypothetical protein